MNVDELQAGRELDALVAEKVMGWVNVRINDKHPVDCHFRFGKGDHIGQPPWTTRDEIVLPYSTDIAAAWQVVEKMRELGWHSRLSQEFNDQWNCRYVQRDNTAGYHFDVSPTAPHAICRAALKAVINDTVETVPNDTTNQPKT